MKKFCTLLAMAACVGLFSVSSTSWADDAAEGEAKKEKKAKKGKRAKKGGQAKKGGKKAKRTPEDRFKKLDANSDGKLTVDELKGKAKGKRAEAMARRFKLQDTDGNGELSLEEFKTKPKRVAKKGKKKGAGRKGKKKKAEAKNEV